MEKAITDDKINMAAKIFLVVIISIIVIKVFKMLMKVLSNVGDIIPETSQEQIDTITEQGYGEGLNWLDARFGIKKIVTSKQYGGGGYNNVSDYMAKTNQSYGSIVSKADEIWAAKIPFYISDKEVLTAISKLKSKADVSILAAYFDDTYGKKWNGAKLSTFLSKYMNTKNLAALSKLINNKPDF